MKIYLISKYYSNGFEGRESVLDGYYLDETEAGLRAIELNDLAEPKNSEWDDISFSVRVFEAAKQGGITK